MIFFGAIFNAILVATGGIIGRLFGHLLKESMRQTLLMANCLAVIYIGISGTLVSENLLIIILSLFFGALLGEWLDLDKHIDNFGKWLQGKLVAPGSNSTIAEGFVTMTLISCVGSMAIMGSLQSGLTGSHETLIAKSVIDFITCVIIASTLGLGASFAAIPIFLYEAGIVALASFVSQWLSHPMINEMSAVGSLLILALGFNLMGLTKIKVSNLLPATFMPILLVPIMM